jgi:hypothetical protein
VKLHVHIGAHKTGSTSLQHRLRENDAALSAAGYAYVPLPDLRRRFSAAVTSLQAVPMPLSRGATARAKADLRTLVAEQGGAHTLILSDENLIGGFGAVVARRTLYP